MNEMKTALRIKIEGYGSLEGFSKCYEAVFNDGDTAKRYIHSLHKRIALCIDSSGQGWSGKSVTIKHSDGVTVIPSELLRYTTTDIVIISGGDSTTDECDIDCDCKGECDCEECGDEIEHTVDDVWKWSYWKHIALIE